MDLPKSFRKSGRSPFSQSSPYLSRSNATARHWIRSISLQIPNRHRPEIAGQRKSVWRTTYDASADCSSGSDDLLNKLQIHCIGLSGELGPFCLKQLHQASRLEQKIHLASSVAPEKEAARAAGL